MVIVGAGPGGSATAYFLARNGLKVLLLDKADFPRDKTCGDGLTPRALGVLDDMGLLARVGEAGCRINGIEIYAPNGRSISAPIPASNHQPAYMLVIPRIVLDDMIRQHAIDTGAVFQSQVNVTDIRSSGNGVAVTGELDGQNVIYQAHVAVVATGANVSLLMRLGFLSQVPPTMVAARAYYDNLDVLHDRVQLRFDGVPMPGYAWVFPTGQRAANIGAGFFAKGMARQHALASPQDALMSFLSHSKIKDVLARAHRNSPIKGYPLRVDFSTAPTYGDRMLLVGEAAGLVNPLSGEGIDYALESGRVAAEQLIGMCRSGDFSPARMQAYDRELRRHFQTLFLFCDRMRERFFNRPALNLLVSIAARRTDLKLLLIRIVLGDQTVPERISVSRVLRVLFLAKNHLRSDIHHPPA